MNDRYFMELAYKNAKKAVSYTHLDVYKRQILEVVTQEGYQALKKCLDTSIKYQLLWKKANK